MTRSQKQNVELKNQFAREHVVGFHLYQFLEYT